MTFTGAIGAAACSRCARIINLCVALRIHPNTLTLIGVHDQRRRRLGARLRPLHAGRFVIMIVANIFDFIDGKVAHICGCSRRSARSGIRRSIASPISRC